MIIDSLEIDTKIALFSPANREESKMADQPHAEIYDDMKERIKALGWRLEDFSDFIGLSKTTMPKWRSIGIPPYALNVLSMLERYAVPAAWGHTRARQGPTMNDAHEAIRSPLTAVVDDAIKKGWQRDQIAESLRVLADQTEGKRPA